jgi:hypothetical protein
MSLGGTVIVDSFLEFFVIGDIAVFVNRGARFAS